MKKLDLIEHKLDELSNKVNRLGLAILVPKAEVKEEVAEDEDKEVEVDEGTTDDKKENNGVMTKIANAIKGKGKKEEKE